MDAKIRNLLLFFINEEEKVSSWGVSNISITETTIKFDVDGFIYSGSVIIKCSKILDYQITFDDGSEEYCSINNIIDVLDSKIERTEHYIRDLEGWFSKEFD